MTANCNTGQTVVRRGFYQGSTRVQRGFYEVVKAHSGLRTRSSAWPGGRNICGDGTHGQQGKPDHSEGQRVSRVHFIEDRFRGRLTRPRSQRCRRPRQPLPLTNDQRDQRARRSAIRRKGSARLPAVSGLADLQKRLARRRGGRFGASGAGNLAGSSEPSGNRRRGPGRRRSSCDIGAASA